MLGETFVLSGEKDGHDPERRLAAILAADVVGYSKLAEADEEQTVARVRTLRRQVFEPKVSSYRGRVFKTTGDGLLIAFHSAVDAVRCAIEIQESLAQRNAGDPIKSPIVYRIGINVGDVISDGEDLQGDCINVAARLEGIAEPGTVYISKGVWDHIRNKVAVEAFDLGERQLKNITNPIQVYRVESKRPEHQRRLPVMAHGARKFRDPVYNYIYASTLENMIIQHPLMNRLHEIRQNATTYLTYHSAHGMRFSHSLGAMHVAGLVFSAALETAEKDIRNDLERLVTACLSNEGHNLNVMPIALLREDALLDNDGLYRQHHLVPCHDSQSLALLVLFQAVRLACLVHDIGHPPFSHTVESALRQALPDKYAGHEQIGLRIVDYIIRQFNSGHLLKEFAAAVFVIAKLLVNKTPTLEGIAKIISGDIDADRLDYVRRDMSTAGLSPTAYDLGRLLDASILRRSPAGTIELALTTGALSMVESFFYARFHLYHYMLWHHNVIRTNLALSRALYVLLTAPHGNLSTQTAVPLSERLKDLAIMASGDPGEYEDFTDGYLVTELRNVLRVMEQSGHSSERRRLESEDAKTLHRALRVFLRRKIDSLPALWKRPDQFHDFAALVFSHFNKDATIKNPMRDLNERLTRAFRISEENSGGANADYVNKQFCRKIEEALSGPTNDKAHFIKVWAYFIIPKFKPTPKDKFVLVSPTRGRDLELPMLSPTVSSLEEAWMQLPHLWLYVESDDGGRTPDIKSAREVTAERLARFLKSI